MEAWQQRVIDEERELHERIVKLDDFLRKGNAAFDALPDEVQPLMINQHRIMNLYAWILRERIKRF